MTKFNKNKHVPKGVQMQPVSIAPTSLSTPIIPQTEKMKESLGNLIEVPKPDKLAQNETKNAKGWEYKIQWIDMLRVEVINMYGQQGWELISTIPTHGGYSLQFKRPL